MNIPDRVNDFLCEVREHDGFANDKNFDRVAAEVFKMKIKALIEECAMVMENWAKVNDQAQRDYESAIMREGARAIRALDS